MRLDGWHEVLARFFRFLAVVGDACGDVRQRLAPLDGDENAPDGRRVPNLDRNRNRRRGGFGRRSLRRAGFAPENDLRRADSRRNRRVASLWVTRFQTAFFRFIRFILPNRRVFKRFFLLGMPFEGPPSSCRFSKKAYNGR